jgi:competence protein ComEC
LLLTYTTGVIEAFARLPLAEISLFPGAGGVALFYAILLTGGWLMLARPGWLERTARTLRARPLAVAVLLAALGVLALTGSRLAERNDSHLHLWFLDMDGDPAVFIRTPGSAHVLVDGGSHPARLLSAIGERLPFDDRAIELWAITQPSLNRIQSADRLLDQFQVKHAVTNGQAILDPALTAVLGRVETVTPLVAGQRVELSDGVALEALHPATTPGETARPADEALVLRLTYGDVSVLLTGDISPDGQAALLANGFGLPATVLQLPSGGVEESLLPEWLAVVQPSAVVAQTRSEDPNQPAPDTLAQLTGLPVYQTGACGTLHLQSDGQRLWVDYIMPDCSMNQ